MEDFNIPQDEDYQDAAKDLFGADLGLFGDVDAAGAEDALDIDEAVDTLYEVIYG
jgi:hypothetical protein